MLGPLPYSFHTVQHMLTFFFVPIQWDAGAENLLRFVHGTHASREPFLSPTNCQK